MKVGMPILFEYNSIEENINKAKELGLDFVELNLNFKYCRDELEHNTNKLAKLLKDNNMQVTLHLYDEVDFALYDEVVEAYFVLIKKYLECAKKLGVKLVNTHLQIGPIVTISGEKNYLYSKDYDDYIKKLTYNLKKLQVLCNKAGALLVLENVYAPEFIIKTYEKLIEERFNFNLDIGHDYTDGEHVSKLFKKHDNVKLLEFHIHDADKKRCHLAISEGKLDIASYKEMAKDAYVVLEVKNSADLDKSVKIFNQLGEEKANE